MRIRVFVRIEAIGNCWPTISKIRLLWLPSELNPSGCGQRRIWLAFFVAFAEATARPKPAHYMTVQMVDDLLSNAEIPRGERTRQGYRLWALRFAVAFKDDPAAMFEEPEVRGEVNEWRKQWAHSPRHYDYAGTVVTRILNWAWKDVGKLRMP